MLREQIKRAIANHPSVSIVGIFSLLSSSFADVSIELNNMVEEGVVKKSNRFYTLPPMYTQTKIHYED
jgi:hypothetical protein